jgi:hypothetical protein
MSDPSLSGWTAASVRSGPARSAPLDAGPFFYRRDRQDVYAGQTPATSNQESQLAIQPASQWQNQCMGVSIAAAAAAAGTVIAGFFAAVAVVVASLQASVDVDTNDNRANHGRTERTSAWLTSDADNSPRGGEAVGEGEGIGDPLACVWCHKKCHLLSATVVYEHRRLLL